MLHAISDCMLLVLGEAMKQRSNMSPLQGNFKHEELGKQLTKENSMFFRVFASS